MVRQLELQMELDQKIENMRHAAKTLLDILNEESDWNLSAALRHHGYGFIVHDAIEAAKSAETDQEKIVTFLENLREFT